MRRISVAELIERLQALPADAAVVMDVEDTSAPGEFGITEGFLTEVTLRHDTGGDVVELSGDEARYVEEAP